MTPASAGAAVRSLAPYSGSLTYSNGSHQGSAVLTLQVTHPGRFTVETPGGTNLPAGSDLAFGDSFGGGLVASIVGGVLLILAGLKDDYEHDGRVITEIVTLPGHALSAPGVTALGACYKQLNSSVGEFGTATPAGGDRCDREQQPR